jgi:hypothetical protein
LVEEPTDLDLARLDAWTRAVRSDYLAARQLEDQLVASQFDAAKLQRLQEAFDAFADHLLLRPTREEAARLVLDRKSREQQNQVWMCFSALLELRDLIRGVRAAALAGQARPLARHERLIREYLESARLGEREARLWSHRSRLRDLWI